jgi:hypothetical protein
MLTIRTSYRVIVLADPDVEDTGWHDEKGEHMNLKEAVHWLRDRGPLDCETYGEHMTCQTMDADFDMDTGENTFYEYLVSADRGMSRQAAEKEIRLLFSAVDYSRRRRVR